MEIGLLLSGGSAATTIDRAVLAEASGFDSVFVGHHRFTPGFGYTVHPWPLLAAIAGRTQRVRLGTSIFLLPLSHPLDVAEEVASLDVVSGGRIIFGPGVGYRRYEYEAMGIPYERRGAIMNEALEILEGVWASERFTYSGEFFSFDDVTVTPRPVQERVPVWVGANVAPAIERAARLADGWIVGFADRLPRLRPKLDRYRALAAEHGRGSAVCLMRLVGLGSTRAEVEQEWLPEIYAMLRGYAKVDAPTERGDRTETSLKAVHRGDVSIEELGNDMFVAGTPDDVIVGLQRSLAETQCDHLVVCTGGLPSEEFIRVMGRDVLPAVR